MHIYVLIDQSGSMATNWDETIGAVNGYIEGLSKKKGLKKALVNVASFDAVKSLNFAELRRNMKVKDWRPISNDDAQPRGMTPLYDAIGKLATWIKDDKPKTATVAIITDGHENASREVNKDAAKAMLDKLRDKKFDVVFLGADFDAFGQGASLGNATGQTLNMTKGNYAPALRAMASRTAVYASTGKVGSWSDEDRKKASGETTA